MTTTIDGTLGITLSGASNQITFNDASTQASNAVPQVTTYTSGSGTYTTPTGAKYITIEMVGGGGGGCGSGAVGGTGGAGGNGGTTTFGTSLLTCTGGAGGQYPSGGSGNGGTATLNSPAVGIASAGNRGQNNGDYNTNATVYTAAAGNTPTPLSFYGSGGYGAGPQGVATTLGAGGGSGAYIKATITSPSSTYSYAVGAAGTAGTAGTSGYVGGAGGSGAIIVTAYF